MKITLEWLEKNRASNGKIDWFLAQRETDGIKVLEKLREEGRRHFFHWLAPRLMTKEQGVEWVIYCAEQVLPIFEKELPADNQPRKAIEAAKVWFANRSEKNRYDAYSSYVCAADAAAKAADAAYVAAHAAHAAYAYDADDTAHIADIEPDEIREAIMTKALEILTQKTK